MPLRMVDDRQDQEGYNDKQGEGGSDRGGFPGGGGSLNLLPHRQW